MEKFKKILVEDLKIYKNRLKKENFSFCNIISNRLVTDAVFLKSEIYSFVGVILKDNLNYFTMVEDIGKFKNYHIKFLDKLIQSDDLTLNFVLDAYINFFNEIWNDISPKYEKYEKSLEYSLYATKCVLDFLLNQLETEDIPYNRDYIIYGSTNELNRIYRNFGALKHQLILKIVLYLSGKLYDYYRVLILSDKKRNIWIERSKNLKKKIKRNIETFDIEQKYLQDSLDLLYEISKDWRHLFIKVGEISFQIQKERTSIPPEIEEELESMVSKVTETELKGD